MLQSTIYTPAPCLPTIFPSGGNGNTQSQFTGRFVDDEYFNIDLPFEMQMFGTRARQLYVTSNSVRARFMHEHAGYRMLIVTSLQIVGLVVGQAPQAYSNSALPSYAFNAAIFVGRKPGVTVVFMQADPP